MDLWDVVRSVQKDYEEATDAYNLTWYKHVQDEYRELIIAGLHDAMMFKTIRIPIEDGRGVLPPDYLQWLKAGYYHHGPHGKGHQLVNLSYNPELRLPAENCCSRETEEERRVDLDTGSLSDPFWGSMWYFTSYVHNGQLVAGAYGAGAGFHHGCFSIDEPNNQLLIERRHHHIKEVVLEYRSDGSSYGINGTVNSNIIEALVNGVHWRITKFRAIKDASLRPMIQTMQNSRNTSWRRVLSRKASFSKETFLDIYRASIQSTPKR